MQLRLVAAEQPDHLEATGAPRHRPHREEGVAVRAPQGAVRKVAFAGQVDDLTPCRTKKVSDIVAGVSNAAVPEGRQADIFRAWIT